MYWLLHNILSRYFSWQWHCPFGRSNCWSEEAIADHKIFDQCDTISYSKVPWTSVPFSEDTRPRKTWGNSYWPVVPILSRVSHCQPSSEFAVLLGSTFVCFEFILSYIVCFCMRRKLLFDTLGKNFGVPVPKMTFRVTITTCHPVANLTMTVIALRFASSVTSLPNFKGPITWPQWQTATNMRIWWRRVVDPSSTTLLSLSEPAHCGNTRPTWAST